MFRTVLQTAAAGCWLAALVSRAFASDDLLVYSGYTNVLYGTMNYNNGWRNWGWVPFYYTNNAAFPRTNAIAIVPSSGYQALHLGHDSMDTAIYTSLTLWVNGGAQGGQAVGISGWLGGVEQTRQNVGINGKLPTNSWLQVTLSLASMGLANKTNLTGIEIWSNSGNPQSNFFVDDISLAAAPAPAVVHVDRK